VDDPKQLNYDPTYFPPRDEPVIVPMPERAGYMNHYLAMNEEHRAYFRYWRAIYERGESVPVHTGYLHLYLQELGVEASSREELERHWLQLYHRYGDEAHSGFQHRLSALIVDLRLQRGCFEFDAIAAGLVDQRLAFDLAIASGKEPPLATMLAIDQSVRIGRAARETLLALFPNIDTAEILAVAKRSADVPVEPYCVFTQLGSTIMDLLRFGPGVVSVRRYSESETVEQGVLSLVLALNDLLGSPVVYQRQPYGHTGMSEMLAKAFAATAESLPSRASLDGIAWNVEHIYSDTCLVLVALVLRLESKPYVEGAIAFSRDLRRLYESVGTQIHLSPTIGSLRKDYWMLSRGQRALWELSPAPSSHGEIQSNVTVARFSKDLQRLLRGSETRGRVIDLATVALAQRRKLRPEAVRRILDDAAASADHES
jgi:hypothetical protein